MADRAELIEIATGFREGLLEGRSSAWMCAVVCWPLAGMLRALYGVECECVEGDLGHCNHVWIELADGQVLDPTADQFNDLFPAMNLPAVYLGPALDIHPARSLEAKEVNGDSRSNQPPDR